MPAMPFFSLLAFYYFFFADATFRAFIMPLKTARRCRHAYYASAMRDIRRIRRQLPLRAATLLDA